LLKKLIGQFIVNIIIIVIIIIIILIHNSLLILLLLNLVSLVYVDLCVAGHPTSSSPC